MHELKLGHSQEAFPIFGSRKMCHHMGYPYINNQCNSLINIMYANYRCHEPERIDVSTGGSISEIFDLIRWIFTDANEASLRLATGLIAKLLMIGGNREKGSDDRFYLFPSLLVYLQQTRCIRIYTHG